MGWDLLWVWCRHCSKDCSLVHPLPYLQNVLQDCDRDTLSGGRPGPGQEGQRGRAGRQEAEV